MVATGDHAAGLPHRAGPQEALRRRRLRHQAPVRPGARPPLPRLLPVHHRLSLLDLRASRATPSTPSSASVRVFDPQGRWLIDHEDARPFGEGWRDAARPRSPAPPAEGGRARGPAPAARPGRGRPGLGQRALRELRQRPGIPGGTAGAAVGLAPIEPAGAGRRRGSAVLARPGSVASASSAARGGPGDGLLGPGVERVGGDRRGDTRPSAWSCRPTASAASPSRQQVVGARSGRRAFGVLQEVVQGVRRLEPLGGGGGLVAPAGADSVPGRARRGRPRSVGPEPGGDPERLDRRRRVVRGAARACPAAGRASRARPGHRPAARPSTRGRRARAPPGP